MNKIYNFSARLDPTDTDTIRATARKHRCSDAEALRIILGAFRGAPQPNVITTLMPPTTELTPFIQSVSDLCTRLDRIVARLNAPLPQSADPDLIRTVQEWRAAARELLPQLIRIAQDGRLIRNALLRSCTVNAEDARLCASKKRAVFVDWLQKQQAQVGWDKDVKTQEYARETWTLFHLLYVLGIAEAPPPSLSPQARLEN